jgi:hypothetical protein
LLENCGPAADIFEDFDIFWANLFFMTFDGTFCCGNISLLFDFAVFHSYLLLQIDDFVVDSAEQPFI